MAPSRPPLFRGGIGHMERNSTMVRNLTRRYLFCLSKCHMTWILGSKHNCDLKLIKICVKKCFFMIILAKNFSSHSKNTIYTELISNHPVKISIYCGRLINHRVGHFPTTKNTKMWIFHTFIKGTLLETRYYVYLICTSHIKLFLSSQLLYPQSWHPKTEISDLKQWCLPF